MNHRPALPPSTAGIGATLERQLATVSALGELLQQEYRCLANQDLKGFEALGEKKPTLLKQLADQEQQLKALLSQTGLPLTTQGVTTYLQQHATTQPQAAIALWEKLQAAIGACRKQNDINQRSVAAAIQHVQQTLTLLSGKRPEVQLYGASGKNQVEAPQHSFGSV